MISIDEQSIYNSYLTVSRSIHNEPFRLRKDFSKFDAEKEITVKRLDIFFKKYTHIRVNDFFKAPYYVFDMDEHFDLNFYITQKALKAYSMYVKKMELDSADSDYNLSAVLASLRFIKEFCKDRGINITKYIEVQDEYMPQFFVHLKDHKVSFYCLLGFNEFEKKFKLIDRDILGVAFSDNILNRLETLNVKFLNSKTCKHLVHAGINKLKNEI